MVIFYTQASLYIHIHLLFLKKSAAYFILYSVYWDFSPRRVSCDSSYKGHIYTCLTVFNCSEHIVILNYIITPAQRVSKWLVLLSEHNPNSDRGLKALHNLVPASSLNSPKPFSLLSGHSLSAPEHAEALLHLCVLSA